MKKIKLFFQKYGLYFAIGFLFLILILVFIFKFFHKKSMKNIEEKINKTIEKAKEHIVETDIKKVEIDIRKNIKLEELEKDKKDFESRLQIINGISDRKRRLKKLIELNKSIEVKL